MIMSVTAVTGLQYGDEGKGKVVEMLSHRYDLIVRFQGGPNAGHTVVNEKGCFHLHQIPSGVFTEGTVCLSGQGTVVDPMAYDAEVTALSKRQIDTANLWVSDRSHVILPHHRLVDAWLEEERGVRRLGTTLRGVGPAYAEKASRDGITTRGLSEILSSSGEKGLLEYIQYRLEESADRHSKNRDQSLADLDLMEYVKACIKLQERLTDGSELVRSFLKEGKRILLEGQLGMMRDPDFGVYPYVTSSSPSPGAVYSGSGLPFGTPVEVLGVAKAYVTSVGEGPMPTETTDGSGEVMSEVGNEYGTTTSRKRRCGWFDAVALREAAVSAGVSHIVLTKLDVLSMISGLRICTSYRHSGREMGSLPHPLVYGRVEPVYEELCGFGEDISGARHVRDLPKRALEYVQAVQRLCRCTVSAISVGPSRSETIWTGW